MNNPSEYRAGYVLHPELTSLTLLKQAVAAGMAVQVQPVNAVTLGDEVVICKLFVDKTSRPKGAKCGILRRKVAAIFKARVNWAAMIEEVL